MAQSRNQSDTVKLAVMQNDIQYIKETIKSVDEKVSKHYVTKDEFEPIKRIVYGLTGLMLIAVMGALMSLVIRK